MQQRVQFSPLGGIRGAQRGTSLSSLPAGCIGLSGLRQGLETPDQEICQNGHWMVAA
jgi:hypothetical protein